MSGASLVSILMPLQNAGKAVGAAIRSVEAQTYPHIELICVDDASEDGTDSIVKGFAQSDKRIRYCRLASNRGVGAARNVALRLARGDYICFVDGDNAIESDFIETMLRRMTADAMDMACCGYDRGQGGEAYSFTADPIWPKERALLALVSDETFFTSLWNKMFRRKLLIADDGAPCLSPRCFKLGKTRNGFLELSSGAVAARWFPRSSITGIGPRGVYRFIKVLIRMKRHFLISGPANAPTTIWPSMTRRLLDHKQGSLPLWCNSWSHDTSIRVRPRDSATAAYTTVRVWRQRLGGLSKAKSRVLILLMQLRAPRLMVRVVSSL